MPECLSDDFWPCNRPANWPRAWPLHVAAKGAQWLQNGEEHLVIQLIDPHDDDP